MDNFDLRKYLAEGKLLKEAFYPEFEGETNDKINDIAIAIVDELESKLDSESSGILKGMDYYVGSDGMDNDEVEQGFTKWFIDLVKYLSKNNNEVTISSVEQDGKVFTPAITLKYLDNGKEDISWKLKRDLAEGKLLKEDQASNLINDGVILYVSDDSKLAPGFVEPKKVGFIVYNKAVKDTSKSILSITGNLSKNKKIIDIFSDNYPNTDPNYISTFFTDSKNWKAINSEDELNSFMSKYSKVYLINHNGDSSKLKESLNEAFNPFLDTEEGGYMREYIDDAAEEEGLDLDYRNEFDEAFDLALTKLRKDHPELDFNLIVQNKESFF